MLNKLAELRESGGRTLTTREIDWMKQKDIEKDVDIEREEWENLVTLACLACE